MCISAFLKRQERETRNARPSLGVMVQGKYCTSWSDSNLGPWPPPQCGLRGGRSHSEYGTEQTNFKKYKTQAGCKKKIPGTKRDQYPYLLANILTGAPQDNLVALSAPPNRLVQRRDIGLNFGEGLLGI